MQKQMRHLANDVSSAKSDTTIGHLSDDSLAEIFSRMPFRSTASCKCVSKCWLDLISSPFFIREFISHQHSLFHALLVFLKPHELMLAFLPPTPALLEEQQPQPPQKTPFFSPDILLKGNVCGCSNGLILGCKNRYTTGIGYFVYDPLTKESIQLAPSPAMYKENLYKFNGNLYAVGFVCDLEAAEEKNLPVVGTPPVASAAAVALGDRNFRVVIIRTFICKRFEFELNVFSSETGLWKRLMINCTEGFAFAPHWFLSCAYGRSLYFMGRTGIFVFDPYTNQSFTLDYPGEVDPMNIMSFGFLGSSCGRLRIADIGPNVLRVWEVIEDEHWHLLHRTGLTTKLPQTFCANFHKRVGGFHPYDGDIVYLHSFAEGVFICNLRTDKFEPVPGYEKSDMSSFQLELPNLLPPQMA